MRLKLKQAAAAIQAIDSFDIERYGRVLEHIQPATREDVFRRWLFTFASVHTTWQLNCALYNQLKDLTWVGSIDSLREKIIASRAGLHNNRTKFIGHFSELFWKSPADFEHKRSSESWVEYRDRLQSMVMGIGRAKTAFGLELLHPFESDVICTDTHIIQCYGQKPEKVTDKALARMEMHWAKESKALSLPPVIVRWAYWDTKQKQADSRFWTHVFEKVNYHEYFTNIARNSGHGAPVC